MTIAKSDPMSMDQLKEKFWQACSELSQEQQDVLLTAIATAFPHDSTTGKYRDTTKPENLVGLCLLRFFFLNAIRSML